MAQQELRLQIKPAAQEGWWDVIPVGLETRPAGLCQRDGRWRASIQGYGLVEENRDRAVVLQALARYWVERVIRPAQEAERQAAAAKAEEEARRAKERHDLLTEVEALTGALETAPVEWREVWPERASWSEGDQEWIDRPAWLVGKVRRERTVHAPDVQKEERLRTLLLSLHGEEAAALEERARKILAQRGASGHPVPRYLDTRAPDRVIPE